MHNNFSNGRNIFINYVKKIMIPLFVITFFDQGNSLTWPNKDEIIAGNKTYL